MNSFPEDDLILDDISKNKKAVKAPGIFAFVLSVISLFLSFVPCLGMYAVFPGVLAIVLAGVAYMRAKKENAPNGLIIAALIISLLSSSIAVYQYIIITNVAAKLEEGLEDINIDIDETDTESETLTE